MKTIVCILVLACAACGGGVGETTEAVAQPVTHSNGAGNAWTDATPLGTYGVAEAMAACNAVPGQTSCVDWPACNGGPDSLVGSYGPEPIANDFYAWIYAGPDAGGYVHVTSSYVAGTGNAVAVIAGNLCLPPGTVLPASQRQPPMTIVARWQ